MKTRSFLLAGLVLAMAFTFSCSSDNGDPPSAGVSSDVASSSSSSDDEQGISSGGSSVLCDFGGGICTEIPAETCLVFGQVVESCLGIAISSSSSDPPSSDSLVPSSSSVEMSSSSAPPSSSSVVPSSSSVEPSSSSIPPSSSSVAVSSSSSVPSSSSLGGGYTGSYGSLSYGGQTYKTVVIGTQTWMAENLNYAVAGSKCYGEGGKVFMVTEGGELIMGTLTDTEVQANCNTYGRLYNWSTAQTICPPDWHLPRFEEWNVLIRAVGGHDGDLRATNWNNDNNGTDTFGFSALPGGYGGSDSGGIIFLGVGGVDYWWSATEYDAGSAYYWVIGGLLGRGYDRKSYLFSVRCVQD